jgi:hypothetical protein
MYGITMCIYENLFGIIMDIPYLSDCTKGLGITNDGIMKYMELSINIWNYYP